MGGDSSSTELERLAKLELGASNRFSLRRSRIAKRAAPASLIGVRAILASKAKCKAFGFPSQNVVDTGLHGRRPSSMVRRQPYPNQSCLPPGSCTAHASRSATHHGAVFAPWRRETASLQAFLEDAEARAVPEEHLARLASAVDEQEQIAWHRRAPAPQSFQRDTKLLASCAQLAP
jgi:hypothetical protein